MPLGKAVRMTPMIYLAVCKDSILTTIVRVTFLLLITNVEDIYPIDLLNYWLSKGSLRPDNCFRDSSGVKSLRKADLRYGGLLFKVSGMQP